MVTNTTSSVLQTNRKKSQDRSLSEGYFARPSSFNQVYAFSANCGVDTRLREVGGGPVVMDA